MVVLKRIKGSTLMETLVATVLIVIIFMISSTLLNTIFLNSIKSKSHHITERLYQLEYEYAHENFDLPYFEDLGDWEFSIVKELNEGVGVIVFKAENPTTNKSWSKKLVDEE